MYENPVDGHEFDEGRSEEEFEKLMDAWTDAGFELDDHFYEMEADLRHWDDPDWDVDLSADGDLAEFLEDLGLRDPDWDWDVGDTPTGA